jgi:DNA-directed RNA polymerase alpha subunit
MNLTVTIANVDEAREAIDILNRYIRLEQAGATPAPAGHAASSTPIADLELGTRACNVLRSEGIETVEELVCYSRWELRKVPNLGVHTLDEITEALTARGLVLGQPFRRIPTPSSLKERNPL